AGAAPAETPVTLAAAGPAGGRRAAAGVAETAAAVAASLPGHKLVAAHELLQSVREYGHLAARVNPLYPPTEEVPRISRETYGLSEEDLAAMPAAALWPDAPADVKTGLDAYHRLLEVYTGPIAYEFAHVHEPDEREWLRRAVESGELWPRLSAEDKKALLYRLTEVEGFETFLHRTFVGQKRFSIEGVDMLVPMLDELIKRAVLSGTRNVMIGMAHRGRLNVLAHVLGKPFAKIFSEFHTAPNKELVPSEGSMGINYGWTGDVKYHLGASRTIGQGEVVQARLVLANNPSHLEFVNPVVEGFTRAAQDQRDRPGAPVQDLDAAMAILIHGDAAFPGEGIVAETLNLSRLPGYQTGGTVHIIANNLLGFTTPAEQGRSTRYASDLAKGFEIPIVHVNADDVEACLAAVRLAVAYRAQFHKDFLIDLIGYRRWGHNEMDDPVVTQPLLYERIHVHPRVREIYAQALIDAGVVTAEEVRQMEAKVQETLRQAYAKVHEVSQEEDADLAPEDPWPGNGQAPPVTRELLEEINRKLLEFPPNFAVYPKLQRILERRRQAFAEGGVIDWAHGEALAFATILADGIPVRLTGQDAERGTFSQRHLVLHDIHTDARYVPLHHLPQAKASFAIYNSPLSEAGVLGFEYGYSIQAPRALVLWEAQYGDFANAAQVIIDQFIASGIAKWRQSCGLVMLLPHGYEGQGPEHSSARLERYLQLSAEYNWVVANPTTSAQYFHLLRRQAHRGQKHPRPLVIMTPKSLLRNPAAASPWQEFVDGRFQPVLESRFGRQHPERVKRLVLCSGKVAIELEAALQNVPQPDAVHIVRLEQLYPLPAAALKEVLARYGHVQDVVWAQEEPENMGAWRYIEPQLRALLPDRRIRYVGRPERSSPAEGLADMHNVLQQQNILAALGLDA
ncbi:2-oxoglutarate dehydrogenase E1 component, partial [Alicyclobacillus cellulosilyticus]|uniref:2-oxoglutarate dehydrogenase E1 component n=1 Tax=Alicyclobacillus cellulosilyticus TaxID=1003997 RepID=UPI001667432E